MTDKTLVIAVMMIATLSVRLLGVFVGQQLPRHGPWARALNALPGCLIVSLVALMLASGGPREWLAGSLALLAAIATRNLPLTMGVGILAIWGLRQMA